MRISKILLPCVIGMALSATASAEVYESKDAQGNTVFSDMPSKGAEVVKVPPTNAADPVVESPRPPPSPETPATPRKTSTNPGSSEYEETDHDDIYYGDHNYDREMDNQTRREQRREADDVAKPKRDRPVATPQRNVSRPAGGGGGGRR